MKDIKLNNTEFQYLTTSGFLPSEWRELICKSTCKKGEYFFLKINEDNSDSLRDLFGKELQVSGFDKNYNLTEDGKVLEDLIDKFFIG